MKSSASHDGQKSNFVANDSKHVVKRGFDETGPHRQQATVKWACRLLIDLRTVFSGHRHHACKHGVLSVLDGFKSPSTTRFELT